MFTAFFAVLMSVSAMLAGVGTSTAAPERPVEHYYANQTPYGDPASARTVKPPSGYELAFIETVGRHGARTLTNPATERRVLQVWTGARRVDALTARGRGVAEDVARFQQAERRIGYGNLTPLGASEWAGIGRRTAASYGSFLDRAVAAGDRVVFETSPVQRTIDSADALRSALQRAVPGLRVEPYVTDAARLLLPPGSTPEGERAIRQVMRRPAVVGAARHLLGRLYGRAYVDTIDDPVQAALDLYLLYCTAPGLTGETDVTFADLVPLDDARVLSSAVDAVKFYRHGPGVAGQDSSYAAARPLLEEFLSALDDRLAGGRTAAVFRLAHGETTMPFAALTGLPGSRDQAPVDAPFSHDDNPWRGEVAGRLAGNVEWTAFQDRSGRALVTVRYHERPVTLSPRCRPAVPYFYRPAELRKCLG